METVLEITQRLDGKYEIHEYRDKAKYHIGLYDDISTATAKIERIFKVDRRTEARRKRARSC